MTAVIRLRGLTKTYPGVTALSAVDLEVHEGETLAVIGENGAGKSTLVRILSGVIPAGAYEGTLELDGHPASFASPRDALAAGLCLIPQETSLHLQLSIAENVLVGALPASRLGRIDWTRANRDAAAITALVGLDQDVRRPVGELSPGQRQLVAIARALSRRPRVLLLDEPTASLDRPEAGRVLEVVDRLRARGVSCVYVSHRLAEVRRTAGRIAVLRNGRLVDVLAGDTPARELIALMLGRAGAAAVAAPGERAAGGVTAAVGAAAASERGGAASAGEPEEAAGRPAGTADGTDGVLFEARGVSVADPLRPGSSLVSDVDLRLRAGEIVGLVGLVGSGRTELLWGLFGALPRRGEVLVNGVPVGARPAASVAAGIGLVTEDRHATGLFHLLSVAQNVTVTTLDRLGRLGHISGRAEIAVGDAQVRALGIRTQSSTRSIASLSGGNQQKTLLARWLERGSRVLLLDEPARGIDVGAREEIYRELRRLATGGGRAILVTSSEPSELVGTCDRYIVLRHGRVVAELDAGAVTEERLLEVASAGHEGEGSPSAGLAVATGPSQAGRSVG